MNIVLLTLLSMIMCYISYRIFCSITIFFEYKRLKAAGVAFNDKNGFSLIRDLISLRNAFSTAPFEYPFLTAQYNNYGTRNLPPITGIIMPIRVMLSINSCDFLEDIYVTKNKYHSKDWMPRALISHFMPNSILF